MRTVQAIMDREEMSLTAQTSCRRLTEAARDTLRGKQPETEKLAALLWACIADFENVPFQTMKGLSFTYTIKVTRQGEKGNELCVSRKAKTITRSSVEMALQTVLCMAKEQQMLPVVMNGPKQLGTFGASYIYPLLIRFGLVRHIAQRRKRKKNAVG